MRRFTCLQAVGSHSAFVGCSELIVIPACNGLMAFKNVMHITHVTRKCMYIPQCLRATVISKNSDIYVSLVSKQLGKKEEKNASH